MNRRTVLSLFAAVALGAGVAAAPVSATPSVGEPAPGFVAINSSGGTISPEALQGKRSSSNGPITSAPTS